MPGLAWVRFAARTLHPALLTDHYYPLSSCGYRPTVEELLSPTVRRARAARCSRAGRDRPRRRDAAAGRRGQQHLLRRPPRCQRQLRLGAVGARLHRPRAERRARGRELPRPARKARRVQPAARPHRRRRSPPARCARSRSGTRCSPPANCRAADRCPRVSPAAPLASSARAPSAPPTAACGSCSSTTLRRARARWPCGCESRARPPAGTQTDPTARDPTKRHAYAGGSVLRLTGPSPAATAGVRLGGRAVSPAGTWSPPTALPAVYAHAGTLSLQLAPSSAAVVTLYPG